VTISADTAVHEALDEWAPEQQRSNPQRALVMSVAQNVPAASFIDTPSTAGGADHALPRPRNSIEAPCASLMGRLFGNNVSQTSQVSARISANTAS